jgi:hypothetical protein
MSALIVLPALMGDWYGLANAIFLAVSILGRFAIVSWYRSIMDVNATNSSTNNAENPRQGGGPRVNSDSVVLYVTSPSGTGLIVRTTRGLTTGCLLTSPDPESSATQLYGPISCCGGWDGLPSRLMLCYLVWQRWSIR